MTQFFYNLLWLIQQICIVCLPWTIHCTGPWVCSGLKKQNWREARCGPWLRALTVWLRSRPGMSKWTITLSHKCHEGKDHVPGKRLFTVSEDQMFRTRRLRRSQPSDKSGRKPISGRGNSVCDREELGGLGELKAGQWGQSGMMFMGGVGKSQATWGL